MCKHACHLVGTMAVQMGHKFEMHALYYLPEVFKMLVISIQVCPHLKKEGWWNHSTTDC